MSGWAIVFYVFAAVVAAAAALIAGLLLWRLQRRRSVRQRNVLLCPPGVDVLDTVRIGGIDQWIHIRGRDSANPVILFLHGGPGAAGIAFGRGTQTAWEAHFTVVQWDQRGGGKTYTSNPLDRVRETMTIERFVQDAIEVVEHLRDRLARPRIILLGHSWGTYLGLAVAHRRPDLVAAYVGSGQIVCPIEYEALGYDLVTRIASERHDTAALKMLASVPRPPSSPDDFIAHSRAISRLYVKYLDIIYGKKAKKPDLLSAYLDALCSPEYSLGDVMNIHRGALFCLDTMFGPRSIAGMSSVRHVDVRDFGEAYQVPILLFLGRHDYATPSVPAAEWFEGVTAPYKRLVWFESSGHSPMHEEPEAYARALIEELSPQLGMATAASSGPVAVVPQR